MSKENCSHPLKKKIKKKRKIDLIEQRYLERITKDNDKTVKKRKLNDGSSMDFKSDGFFDIWNVKEEVKKIDGYEEDLVVNKNKRVNPFKWEKNNEIDAVEVVHPGASYNPSEEDHQVLLKKAVDEQLKKKKIYDTVMDTLKVREDKRNIKELDEELSHSEDKNMDEDDTDPIKEHVNIPVIPRKSTAERNREKRKKIHESNVMKSKLEKMRKNENVRNIFKEVEEGNKGHNEIIANRKKLKEEKGKISTKRVGKEKIGEKDIEVLLTEEIPKTLRNFNPSTSLIEDRFHSLQKRNIIETRSIKNYNRRYPIKMKVNIRHREFATEQEKIYSS
jgi:nucleolar protein 53